MPFSAVCVFCEDVREEKSGQHTIVGALPDNLVINTPAQPAPNWRPLISKIGAYMRIHFETERNAPKEVSARILNTDGNAFASTTWQKTVVDKAFADSKTNKIPYVGLIFTVAAGPFPIPAAGKIIALATVDGDERVAGAINVIFASASLPPS